jgi:hypothetical protein
MRHPYTNYIRSKLKDGTVRDRRIEKRRKKRNASAMEPVSVATK